MTLLPLDHSSSDIFSEVQNTFITIATSVRQGRDGTIRHRYTGTTVFTAAALVKCVGEILTGDNAVRARSITVGVAVVSTVESNVVRAVAVIVTRVIVLLTDTCAIAPTTYPTPTPSITTSFSTSTTAYVPTH